MLEVLKKHSLNGTAKLLKSRGSVGFLWDRNQWFQMKVTSLALYTYFKERGYHPPKRTMMKEFYACRFQKRQIYFGTRAMRDE